MRPRDAAVASRTSTLLACIALVVFAGTRIWLVTGFAPRSSDLGLYFQYAEESVRDHTVPYRDFAIEYPPLAWWTMAAMYGIDVSAHSAAADATDVNQRFESYRTTYRGVMFKIDALAAVVMFLALRRRSPELAGGLALAYVVCTATMAHVLYDRLDLGLWLWLIGWAYCWIRAAEGGPNEERWALVAYVTFGASIAYKLAPVVGLPLLLLAEWRHPRRARMALVALAGLAIGLVAPLAAQFSTSGSGVFGFLSFYFGRAVQLESLYATLLEATRFLDPGLVVTRTASGYNIEGGVASRFIAASTVVTIAFNIGLFVWAMRRPSGTYRRADAYRLACLAIAGTVIVSKVLSPQFMVWALPLLLLLAADTSPEEAAWPTVVGIAAVAIAACTTWIFPYHYVPDGTTDLALVPADNAGWPASPWPMVVVAVRNLAYLALVIGSAMYVFRTSGGPTSSRSDARSRDRRRQV